MRFLRQTHFRTPESVELEFTLGGIGNRTLALILDYLLWGLLLTLTYVAWALAISPLTEALDSLLNVGSGTIGRWLLAVTILLAFAIYVGYFTFFELLWRGQTPGKRFARVRVVDDSGRPPNLQQAALRALLRPIDDLAFIGFFAIALGKQEKRLGDMVAGTIVIRDRGRVPETTITTTPDAQSLVPQLLEAANVAALTPQDFAIVRQYLQRRQELFPQARIEVCRQLAHYVKDAIALEEIPAGVTATQFLEAAYLAYQKR